MDKQTFIRRAQSFVGGYRPNAAVREQLGRLKLIAVVGPTGVGKTSIMEKSGVPYILSDVTRVPRDGETDGVDYRFRTDYEQLLHEIESGEFVQYVIQRETDLYGTKASAYPQDGACTMAILARVLRVFWQLGFGTVVPVYIVPPSYDEWLRRIGAHNDSDLADRLKEAKESLELALADSNYLYVLNDDLATATEHFKQIAAGTPDMTQQENAKHIAADLLEHLKKDTGDVAPPPR